MGLYCLCKFSFFSFLFSFSFFLFSFLFFLHHIALMDIPFLKVLFDKEMMIFLWWTYIMDFVWLTLFLQLISPDWIDSGKTNKQTKNKNKQPNKRTNNNNKQKTSNWLQICACTEIIIAGPKKSQFSCFNYQIYNSDHQQHGFIFHDWKARILNSTQYLVIYRSHWTHSHVKSTICYAGIGLGTSVVKLGNKLLDTIPYHHLLVLFLSKV